MRAKKETIGAIAIACAFSVNALAQHSSNQEAPSTVNAQYVEASPTTELKPGEKIGKLFALNSTTDFILQRLTARRGERRSRRDNLRSYRQWRSRRF